VIRFARCLVVAAALIIVPLAVDAQDRLKTMPGYDQYQRLSKEIPSSVKMGNVAVTWKDGGRSFEYKHDAKTWRFDFATGKAEPVEEPKEKEADAKAKADDPGKAPAKGRGQQRGEGKAAQRGDAKGQQRGEGRGRNGDPAQPPGGPVARGRQALSATSPDGKMKAVYRDRNLWLTNGKGEGESAITTDGGEKDRIKYGTASWVYGEELFQRSAMWWSPDSKKLAYYRFDESQVADYYLALAQTSLQDKLDVEPYPKAGAPNPVVDLFVYDVAEKQAVRVDVRDGHMFDNNVVGHYVYHVSWSADGKELLFNRTNRRQNIMEFIAADPETGKCRVIVHEEWPDSWTENAPPIRWLKDNKRFLWISERTGWRNLFLYDLSGKLLNSVTEHPFEVANIVRVDEDANLLWYMARDGDNPMKLQLHRVGLDGRGDQRLTDPAFLHNVDIAPDGKHFIDVIQSHDAPPVTRVCDSDGKVVAELAKSDTTKFDELGLKRVELFTYKANDGVTDLYGMLHFPSSFDPAKKYPLLVSVYAGPQTNGARESFTVPSALTEYGFLFATLDSRSAAGRGKKFLDAIYLKLGVTEIDDQAAGVKALGERSYVDKSRVGIFGGSYGGYASILCLLRYPDVFQAACASSPVTDYRLYDSIYTERYMWIPQENSQGYDAGSAMKYVDKLKGRLMIFFGTADNNVHPSNSLQLIQKLQRAGKSFDVQVGPDQGHSGISQPRMMEFFIENLVTKQN
jgi:dipeptidyl-peptidase-4